MKCIATQTEGPNIHTRLSTHRGWQAARTIGSKDIKYAESFTMSDSLVVGITGIQASDILIIKIGGLQAWQDLQKN